MHTMALTHNRTQRGAALIVSLIILLILSILGVQNLQTSTLEKKMAGNFRDKKMAFEAAEIALTEAEKWLSEQTFPPAHDNSGTYGIWNFGSANIYDSSFWDDATAVTTNLVNLPTDPAYVIEFRSLKSSGASSTELGSIGNSGGNTTLYKYRITARGIGGSTNAEVLLQSHFDMDFE